MVEIVKSVLMWMFQLAGLGIVCFTLLAALAISTDWKNKK